MKQGRCPKLEMNKDNYNHQFIYSKVDNDKRMLLLQLVKEQGKSLKEASNLLKINYSTAKTILRVYRIEKRILKKTSIKTKKKFAKFTCALTETRPDASSNPDSPLVRESPEEIKKSLETKCELGNFSLNQIEKVNSNDYNREIGSKTVQAPTINTTFPHFSQEKFKSGYNSNLNVIKISNPNLHQSQSPFINSNIPLQNIQLNQLQNYLNSIRISSKTEFSVNNLPNDNYKNYFNEYLQKIQLNMLCLQNCFKEIDHNSKIINNIQFLIDKIKMKNMY